VLGPRDTWNITLSGDEEKAKALLPFALQQASILKTQSMLAVLGELTTGRRELALDRFGSYITITKTFSHYAITVFITPTVFIPVVEVVTEEELEEVLLDYAMMNYRVSGGSEFFDSGYLYDFATNDATDGWLNIASRAETALRAWTIHSETGDVYSAVNTFPTISVYKNTTFLFSTSIASWDVFISRDYAPVLQGWVVTHITDTHIYLGLREYESGFVIQHGWFCKMSLDGTKVGVIHLGGFWPNALGANGSLCYAGRDNKPSTLNVYDESTFGNASSSFVPTPIRSVTHGDIENWVAGDFQGSDLYYMTGYRETISGLILPKVGIYDITGDSFDDVFASTDVGDTMSALSGLEHSIAVGPDGSDFLFTFWKGSTNDFSFVGRCYDNEGVWTFDSVKTIQDDGLPSTFRQTRVKLLLKPEA
jgi:hypothetical protein